MIERQASNCKVGPVFLVKQKHWNDEIFDPNAVQKDGEIILDIYSGCLWGL